MLQYLVIAGALANFLGSAVYIHKTLQGITKPNRVTFFIWALAPLIATPAALAAGVTWAVVPVFMAGFLPLLIFLASFVNKNAYWELGWFDYFCGAVAIFGLILWAITQNPITAILFAIIADAFAALPTILKAWRFPETEYWSGYAGALFSALTGIIAAKAFVFAEVAFPIYLVVACAMILAGIFRKKIRFNATN